MLSRWLLRLAVTITSLLLWVAPGAVIHAQPADLPTTFRGAPLYRVGIIASYPHDTNAWTQGLLWHEGALFESTGQYGESGLRRVALETGEVLQESRLPDAQFAEGLALHDGVLYQLTWRSNLAYARRPEDLEALRTLHYTGEGWGLASDGQQLVLSDGTNTLRVLDPETFETVREVDVWDMEGQIRGLNELEFVEGELWANVLPTELIARIDVTSGQVTGWIYLGDLHDPERDQEQVLNGIAYDERARRVFVTGKYWDTLYEIEVFPAAP